jgi:type I restriction enzyme S subunit
LNDTVNKGRHITYGIVKPGEPDENGVLMIRSQDYANGWCSVDQIMKVSHKIEAPYRRSRVIAGDILITVVGANLGKMAVVPDWLDGANISRAAARVGVDPQKANAHYVEQILQSGGVDQLIKTSQIGGAQPVLNLKELGTLTVPLPPLPEQRRIAAVLGAWDRAIATVQQLLAAQQQRKQGLMQELLTGKRRFPGFKKKWRNVRMGELFERVTRKNEVGDTHVMTISAQHGLIDQREIFNKSVAGANLAGYYLLKRSEFAYNKSSSNGYPYGAIKRLERYEQGILSVLYICFRLKSGAGSGDYFSAYFDAGLMDKGISMIAQEGARNHGLLNVSTTDFFDIDLHIPDEAEQAVIAKAVGALNKETDAIQNYLDHLTTQKRGLMQQLMTGAVRVKNWTR